MTNTDYEANPTTKRTTSDVDTCELTLFMRPIERNKWACDVYAVFSRPGCDRIRHEVATGGNPEHPIEFVKAGMILHLLGWHKVCERPPTCRDDEITLESFPLLSVNARFGTVEVYERPILDGRLPDEPSIDLQALDEFLANSEKREMATTKPLKTSPLLPGALPRCSVASVNDPASR